MSDPSSGKTASFPERIGRYDLLLPIASGGMGTVYLACARGPGGFEVEVALKLTHPHLRENPEFNTDLLEEAKLAARIRHCSVAAVIDADVDPLGVYLVMEYVEGDTLAGLIRASRSFPTKVGLRVLLDALDGLHAAHELRDEHGAPLGVVHRDFTPQNILVGTDGLARLTDFGVAKVARRLSHTRTGLIKGKTAYMSPEQISGMPIDRRTDVRAAGVIAWQLLARRRLYALGDEVATMLKITTETPPRLREIDPSIPRDVEAAVALALDRDPETRCPSALAFGRQLGAACREHGLVAESEEVADRIALTIGPKLAIRREQLSRVKALRASGWHGEPPRSAEVETVVGAAATRESPITRAQHALTVVIPPGPPPTARIVGQPSWTDGSPVVAHPQKIAPMRTRLLGVPSAVVGIALMLVIGAWRIATVAAAPSAAATMALSPGLSLPPVPTAAPTIAPPPMTRSESEWTPIPVTLPVEALPKTPMAQATASAPLPEGGKRRPRSLAPRSQGAPDPLEGPTPLAPSPY